MEGDINQNLLAEAEQSEIIVKEVRLKEKIWTEMKKMWVVAAPAIFTRFSTFGVTVISQAFVGHIGATELAAYSLCFTVLFRFGNGILHKEPELLTFLAGMY
ncbi:Multi antimicrobial extrusion protein [Corchorus olitorius]|uniref:Multi antimicrobial extrusion protein n=1 Tax=Corchorus olitorius TaxID=93759 RepID=A0A1R3L4E5_9ROSI|nr:Multi antimicrobial extrusion protein [Corchorus olitorius]